MNRRDVRRVLMVSPHFPPDSSAASHRVRLLAPYLAENGWEPTIVTVDERDYEGGLETALNALVPDTLRVVRCRAWSAGWTRAVGFGDLGLRAFSSIRRTCRRLLQQERFDALFVTVYPVYTALLGPLLKREFNVKFVLDYQDPWVGSWGLTVGGGAAGSVDLRSRLSRRLATWLEPVAVTAADAITAVSSGTYEEVAARIPEARNIPRLSLPLGWDRGDFLRLGDSTRPNVGGTDGRINLVYVGTILPNGVDTLRALLEGVRRLREDEPLLYGRLRLSFLGTSNQFTPDAPVRVLPIAAELGVQEAVTEVAPRIPYADALAVLRQADGILLLGSTESHYTASKLYPALLAGRPILAAFHRASSVVDILGRVGGGTAVRVVSYGAEGPRAPQHVACMAKHLTAMVRQPMASAALDLRPIEDVSARSLAGTLCRVLDQVHER